MSQADNVRLMKVEAEVVRLASALTELRGQYAEVKSQLDALCRAATTPALPPQPERKRA